MVPRVCTPKKFKTFKNAGQRMPKMRNRSEDRFCNFDQQLRENVAETVVSHACKQKKHPQLKNHVFSKGPFSGAEPINVNCTETQVLSMKTMKILGILHGKIKRPGLLLLLLLLLLRRLLLRRRRLLLLLLLVAAPAPYQLCLLKWPTQMWGRGHWKTVSNMSTKCFPRRVLASSRRLAL